VRITASVYLYFTELLADSIILGNSYFIQRNLCLGPGLSALSPRSRTLGQHLDTPRIKFARGFEMTSSRNVVNNATLTKPFPA
jgi:hypothetical protein